MVTADPPAGGTWPSRPRATSIAPRLPAGPELTLTWASSPAALEHAGGDETVGVGPLVDGEQLAAVVDDGPGSLAARPHHDPVEGQSVPHGTGQLGDHLHLGQVPKGLGGPEHVGGHEVGETMGLVDAEGADTDPAQVAQMRSPAECLAE